MKEIRIKYDDDISDELASQLVGSVINQGKISNYGKSYCFVTVFKVNGTFITNSATRGKEDFETCEEAIEYALQEVIKLVK